MQQKLSKNGVQRVLGWERISDSKKNMKKNLEQDEALSMSYTTFNSSFSTLIGDDGTPIPLDHHHLPTTYRTLSQNEFLCECVIDGQGISVVHFFDEESKYNRPVDLVLGNMSKKYSTTTTTTTTSDAIKFIRLRGKDAPLVSKKLLITRAPMVLVMKDRQVYERLSHFGESEFFSNDDECRMLQRWIKKQIADLEES